MSGAGEPSRAGFSKEDEVDLAEAFKKISQGERTAAALEGQLDSIEKKIDDLIAQANTDQKDLEQQEAATKASKNSVEQVGERVGKQVEQSSDDAETRTKEGST